MANVWTSYTTVALAGFFGFLVTIENVPSPEEYIIGEWKELKWEYEKVDKAQNDSANYKHISDDVKDLIGQNLIIHKAETWVFLPGRKVKLIGEDTTKTVQWRITGRGHILQFKHENGELENYALSQLNENEMVLNFEADIEARGIAKLTFRKIKSDTLYAQETQ